MKPLVFTTNIAWDAIGKPDTRPNTWGTTDYIDVPITFQQVPAGRLVRVTRMYGDLVAWPHGVPSHATCCGVLTGMLSDDSGQSPYVDIGRGSSGCPFYIQGVVSGSPNGIVPLRAPFDFDTTDGGLLDKDNVMKIRLAIFMNETGVSIHCETTAVVEFEYVVATS